MRNGKPYLEWWKQARYDYVTAQAMFKTGRYIYAVFMCHLSLEKTLKGLLAKTSQNTIPRTHDLLFLVEKTRIEMPEPTARFVETLNSMSIITRYPEDLRKLQRSFRRANTEVILRTTGKVIEWLKKR